MWDKTVHEVTKLRRQLRERDVHLPLGNQQKVYIDVRGSDFTVAELDVLAGKFVRGVDAIVPKGRVRFIIGDGPDDWLEFD